MHFPNLELINSVKTSAIHRVEIHLSFLLNQSRSGEGRRGIIIAQERHNSGNSEQTGVDENLELLSDSGDHFPCVILI